MNWIIRVLTAVAANAFALWLANKYIPGIAVTANIGNLLFLALILALLNFVLKPILDLIFGPLIVITLGIGLLVVNGIIVWLLPIIASHLDILQGSITIQTTVALVWTTLIVTFVNFVIHLAL
jgi:putative membrane protein